MAKRQFKPTAKEIRALLPHIETEIAEAEEKLEALQALKATYERLLEIAERPKPEPRAEEEQGDE